MRRCPDEEQIKYLVLDATLNEVVADLAGLHRLLRDQPPDLIVGNFTFGVSRANLGARGLLAKLCAALPATFLAAAHPQLVGNDSFGTHADPDDWKFAAPVEVREAWDKLRTTLKAAHLGLALPRFLLRQPYGKTGDPVETLPFEELTGEPAHESFLWGHSTVLCASAAIDAIQSGDLELAEFVRVVNVGAGFAAEISHCR